MNKVFLLILSSSIIFCIGLLMIFNISSAEILNKSLETSTHLALIKQGIYGIFGIILGLVIFYIGYSKFIQISPFLLFICIFFLFLVFLPKIGQTINGAKRWITIGGISLQPSEFA